MANWYCGSDVYAAVTPWAASTAVPAGAYRRPLAAPAIGREYVFRATVAGTGTTGASEPVWPTAAGGTVVDNAGANQVTWTEVTGQEAHQSAGNWTAPAGSLTALMHATNGRASASFTDTIFVSDEHAKTFAGAVDYNRGGMVVCVTVGGSTLPPDASSLSSGARESTTGAVAMTFSGTNRFYGCEFYSGAGATAANLVFGRTAVSTSIITFKNCALGLTNTGASSVNVGAASGRVFLTLDDTSISFGAAGQGIITGVGPSTILWRNGMGGPVVEGTVPTNLFLYFVPPFIRLEGLDLSNVSGTIFQTPAGANQGGGRMEIVGCKLHPTAIIATNYRMYDDYSEIRVNWSDSTAGASQRRMLKACSAGVIESDATLIRSTGADDGVAGFAWKFTNSVLLNGPPDWSNHPVTPWMQVWSGTTGTSRTLTVHGIADKAALPDTSKFWLEVGYMLASDTPALTMDNSQAPPPLPEFSPVANTATTEDWDNNVSARANSTLYAVGAAIKVASNPGRVFFCTIGGTTAGTPPAGYTTAVDGNSVTDGGVAVFRAGWRFKMSKAVTPQKAGWIAVRVHHIDSQSAVTNAWVDPTVVVT